MAARNDVDSERYGLDPEYDYYSVERIAEARADGPLDASTRGEFLRHLGAGAGAVLIAGAVPSSALARLLEASAKIGGTINFLSWQGYDIPGVAKPWAKRNGVTFNAKYLSGNQDLEVALQTGGGKSPYNLATYFAGDGVRWRQKGYAQYLDIGKVPNYKKLDPIFQKSFLTGWWRSSRRYWGVPFTFGGNTGLYDSASVAAPRSWYEFLRPSWKNKFVIVNDAAATLWMGAHLAGVYNRNTLWTQDDLDAIFAVLDRFKANARTIATYGQLPDLFASGEIVGATAGWAAVANQAAAKGKTSIRSFLPKEGSSSFIDVWCLPPTTTDKPQDRNAVYAFINFSLTPRAQAYAARTLSGGVLTPGAVPLLDAASKAAYPYKNLRAFFAMAPVAGLPAERQGEFLSWTDILTQWRAWRAS